MLTDAGIARRVNFAQFTDFSEYLVTSQPGSKVAVLLRIEDWLREDLKLRSDGSFGESWMRNELRVRIDEFVRQFTILLRLANQVWFVAVPSTGWISQGNNLQGLCRTYTNLLVARVRTLPGIAVLNWPTSVPADESTDRETD
ncbi:MAG: hypothetical protein JO061_22265, partial [Acidobacteriaceae bacterium]|nr:hypothetical protein [Acidobacteriaceae bacterium]